MKLKKMIQMCTFQQMDDGNLKVEMGKHIAANTMCSIRGQFAKTESVILIMKGTWSIQGTDGGDFELMARF
jgi:hypothetical protein